MNINWKTKTSTWARLAGLLVLVGWMSAAAAVERPGLQALTQLAQSLAQPEALLTAVLVRDDDAEPVPASAWAALGLRTHALRHLPLVLAEGTPAALRAAVSNGLARDAYPNTRLHYFSAESTAAIGADVLRMAGVDCRGIGIAIVDSGIDGMHADLANNVVRNVRVYGPEYLSLLGVEDITGPFPSDPALIVPFESTPFNNTDTVGHGTHVAGIAAADGAGNPNLIGVAPAADLIGYSTGEILFIFTALASFDDILATQEEFNIRVVNNSWGSAYRTFDPNDPISVATRVLTEAGITVVFAAGNSSTEMSTNPHALAPWVISVAATDVGRNRAGFSSAGLAYDGSEAVELGENGHARFLGNRLGLSYPHVAAPGANIDAPGTPTGLTVTTGTPPDGSANLSGTSMAAPHVAGVAALLLQVRPELTPAQVRQVLELTAGPMADQSAVWQVGFGFIDAAAAVAYVQDPLFSAERLLTEHAQAAQALLDAREFAVAATDLWRVAPLPLSLGGLDQHDLSFEVLPGVDAIRASVAFPGDLGVAGLNVLFSWTATLLDPMGAEVATSDLLSLAAVGVLQADFPEQAMPGEWTLNISGDVQLTQPGALFGGVVSAAAVQLVRQVPADTVADSADPAARDQTLRAAGGALGLSVWLVLAAGAVRWRRFGARCRG